MKKLINIFCTKCQEVTPHEGSLDGNGEFVFHCTAVTVPHPKNPEKEVFHHFLKLPADYPVEKFAEYFQTHKEHNAGQVSMEEQEKKLAAILDLLGESPEEKPAENTASADAQPSAQAPAQ